MFGTIAKPLQFFTAAFAIIKLIKKMPMIVLP